MSKVRSLLNEDYEDIMTDDDPGSPYYLSPPVLVREDAVGVIESDTDSDVDLTEANSDSDEDDEDDEEEDTERDDLIASLLVNKRDCEP